MTENYKTSLATDEQDDGIIGVFVDLPDFEQSTS